MMEAADAAHDRLPAPTGLYADPRFHLFVEKVSRSSSVKSFCACGEQDAGPETSLFCSDGVWTKTALADPEGDELEELARSFRWLQLTNVSPSLVKKRGQALQIEEEKRDPENSPLLTEAWAAGHAPELCAPGVCTAESSRDSPAAGAALREHPPFATHFGNLDGGSRSDADLRLRQVAGSPWLASDKAVPPGAAPDAAASARSGSLRGASLFLQKRRRALPKTIRALETQKTGREAVPRQSGSASPRPQKSAESSVHRHAGSLGRRASIPTTVS
ncbi:hypothetical protein TGDOM2_250030 [Toxoplasma gondii GAB2-2007-GAL-DOM2]|uniref:Uncharacterized protein n=2 Tax=Toxoplasma gondii TaxID=5811 RepID=A0A086KJS2_TOXGO|nr:hypothetical protein TGDOM2_250030 [Toxoplasma gondii GAB2-2007-GAL-DOM2]KFG44640.1 hypothetical protein TGFOU_250030 [Toxoplasma gondii FOU]